jgi:hypothetical protein
MRGCGRLAAREDDVEDDRPAGSYVVERSVQRRQDLGGILDPFSHRSDDGGE